MLHYRNIAVFVIIGLFFACECRHLNETPSEASSAIDPKVVDTRSQTDTDTQSDSWNADESFDTVVDTNAGQVADIPVPNTVRERDWNSNQRIDNEQSRQWSPAATQQSMSNDDYTDDDIKQQDAENSDELQAAYDNSVDTLTPAETQVDDNVPIRATDNRIDPESVDYNIDHSDNHIEDIEEPHRDINNIDRVSLGIDQVNNEVNNQISRNTELTRHNTNTFDETAHTHSMNEISGNTHMNNDVPTWNEGVINRGDETSTHMRVIPPTTRPMPTTTNFRQPPTTPRQTTTAWTNNSPRIPPPRPPTTTRNTNTAWNTNPRTTPLRPTPTTTPARTITNPRTSPPRPTTTRQPGDVDPLNIFVDDIKFQRFPKPMDFSTFQTKILDRPFKKLYILEESDKKLFQYVRQLEATYTMEGEDLYVTFLFRFVFSRQCQEIQKFRLGKRVGNTNEAYFEKDLGNDLLERVMFFTEMPEDYVFFMSCTDRNTSPYACRDSYYVTLDSLHDPPNQFPWFVAANELYRKMSLSFRDPRFIFNFVMTPCVRQE